MISKNSQNLLTEFGRHEVHACSKLSTLPIALLLLQLQSKLSPGLDSSLSVSLDPKPHQHKLCAIITSNLAHKLVAANLSANFRPCCLRETTMPAVKRDSSWQSASTKHVFCCRPIIRTLLLSRYWRRGICVPRVCPRTQTSATFLYPHSSQRYLHPHMG